MQQAGLNVNTFPVIKSTVDIMDIYNLYHQQTPIAERLQNPPFFQAYDIDNFYPSIPHEHLITAVSGLLDTAWSVFDQGNTKGLRVPLSRSNHSGAIAAVPLTAAPRHAYFILSKSQLLDMLKVLLKHSYVRFGALIVRAQKGIPMGTHCGPDLANGFGLFYEFKYLRKLVVIIQQGGAAAAQAMKECRALTFYVRFIDDILNLNNLHFQQILNTYPQSISFTASTPRGNGSNGIPFMDALIYQSDKAPYQLAIRLHDKRRGINYANIPIIQYTHSTSFLPWPTKFNIFTGQFHRLSRLITNEKTFHLEVAILLTKLIAQKAMPRQPLIRKLRVLLFHPGTRYRHGQPVREPGYHRQRILFWMHYGEQRGLHALINQTEFA